MTRPRSLMLAVAGVEVVAAVLSRVLLQDESDALFDRDSTSDATDDD